MNKHEILTDLCEMLVLSRVINDLNRNYIRSTDAFYINKKLHVTITLDELQNKVLPHAKLNGLTYNDVRKWFKNVRSVYSLLSAIRKHLLGLYVTAEQIDNFTVCLGYGEYKRGKITFFRIEQMKGNYFNTNKFKALGKDMKLRIKAIMKIRRVDARLVKKEIFRNESTVDPYYEPEII